MKKTSVNKRPKKRASAFSPATFGLAIFGLACALWIVFFYSSQRYEVESRDAPARLRNERKVQPTDTLIGPQTPPVSQNFYHYTERIEEQSAILLTLLITALHENLKFRRNPKDLPAVVALAKTKQLSADHKLWQDTWDKHSSFESSEGWIQTARVLHYIRYRAQPSPAIEIMTVSLLDDSQVTVMRVPEVTGSPVILQNDYAPEGVAGIALFVSPNEDTKLLPAWAASSHYEMWGWKRESLKLSLASAERQSSIKQWIDSQPTK